MNKDLDQWLEGRPDIIRKLAYKYPPGYCFIVDDIPYWVVSYNEDGSIYVSDINPNQYYEAALMTRRLICADCLP